MSRGLIMLPLDSKSFDKWVLRDEINMALKGMRHAIEKFFNDDSIKKDMLRVMDLIIKSYNVHGWRVKIGKKTSEMGEWRAKWFTLDYFD